MERKKGWFVWKWDLVVWKGRKYALLFLVPIPRRECCFLPCKGTSHHPDNIGFHSEHIGNLPFKAGFESVFPTSSAQTFRMPCGWCDILGQHKKQIPNGWSLAPEQKGKRTRTIKHNRLKKCNEQNLFGWKLRDLLWKIQWCRSGNLDTIVGMERQRILAFHVWLCKFCIFF